MLSEKPMRIERDDGTLVAGDVAHTTGSSTSDAQIAAFAMAVLSNDVTMDERVAVTRATCDSGSLLEWHGTCVDRPIVDKHSTRRDDTVSLLLATLVNVR